MLGLYTNSRFTVPCKVIKEVKVSCRKIIHDFSYNFISILTLLLQKYIFSFIYARKRQF